MADRDRTLNDYVATILRKRDQPSRFNQVKTVLKHVRPLEFDAQGLARLIRETGTFFMTAAQGKELKEIIEQKYSSPDYRFHHVICSRILDHWNIQAHYGDGIGYCYYGQRDQRPPIDSEAKFLLYYAVPQHFTEHFRKAKEEATAFYLLPYIDVNNNNNNQPENGGPNENQPPETTDSTPEEPDEIHYEKPKKKRRSADSEIMEQQVLNTKRKRS